MITPVGLEEEPACLGMFAARWSGPSRRQGITGWEWSVRMIRDGQEMGDRLVLAREQVPVLSFYCCAGTRGGR